MEDTTDEEVVSENPPAFLRAINDQECYWTFKLLGRTNITGRVIDYLYDDRNLPITLQVKSPNGKTTDIIWANIQSITKEKEV